MTEYRDPQTGKRTAVLRPENPALSLKRLAEWNTLMDAADILTGEQREEAKRLIADTKWLELKREQGWRFLGWLLVEKGKTSGGPTAPGDLNVGELEFEKDWRR